MITLKIKKTPLNLGDMIDMVLLCHMISKVKGERVNLQCAFNDKIDYFKNLIDLGDVVINSDLVSDQTISYEPGLKGFPYYITISKQVDNIQTKNKVKQFELSLPNKFITTQWDAKQLYRNVNRWDNNRTSNIEKFYRNLGYDIMDIGGGKFTIEETAYILSKASMHIGSDSGMAHFAKIIMPIQNIHVYVNVRRRDNDNRFPDGWSVSPMARELFRRGVMMNYCENPSNEQVEYFKDTKVYV